MSVVEFVYQFYNPKNPKCRACKFWREQSFDCLNKNFKGNKTRYHNSKACSQFELKKEN